MMNASKIGVNTSYCIMYTISSAETGEVICDLRLAVASSACNISSLVISSKRHELGDYAIPIRTRAQRAQSFSAPGNVGWGFR